MQLGTASFGMGDWRTASLRVCQERSLFMTFVQSVQVHGLFMIQGTASLRMHVHGHFLERSLFHTAINSVAAPHSITSLSSRAPQVPTARPQQPWAPGRKASFIPVETWSFILDFVWYFLGILALPHFLTRRDVVFYFTLCFATPAPWRASVGSGRVWVVCLLHVFVPRDCFRTDPFEELQDCFWLTLWCLSASHVFLLRDGL